MGLFQIILHDKRLIGKLNGACYICIERLKLYFIESPTKDVWAKEVMGSKCYMGLLFKLTLYFLF